MENNGNFVMGVLEWKTFDDQSCSESLRCEVGTEATGWNSDEDLGAFEEDMALKKLLADFICDQGKLRMILFSRYF